MTNLVSETNWEDITENGGIKIIFSGKADAQRIARKVKPRVLKKIAKLSIDLDKKKSKNLIIEGDNLKVMTSLYQYHGKVDLILTDPPYNTGEDFRYNDNEENIPNDKELGDLIKVDDPAKHTKWMKFMLPRLQLMKQMLKPNGVLAICIDYRELSRLIQLSDEIFGEENRLGIINWQKTTAVRADSKHLYPATEYVLVYGKKLEKITTNLLPRTEKMLSGYQNEDNDPNGSWITKSFTAQTPSYGLVYGIQNPFTGKIQYPPPRTHWRRSKSRVKPVLEQWGSEYEERDLRDGRTSALVIKGSKVFYKENENPLETDLAIKKSSQKAYQILKNKPWPEIFFGKSGTGSLAAKQYLKDVQGKGLPPTTFWPKEEFIPCKIGSVSLPRSESGHNQGSSQEIHARVGYELGEFVGVKPLKLFAKIIQIWCPFGGLVCDPFAGTGTTGEAILQLNNKNLKAERERAKPTNWNLKYSN